MDIRTLVCPSVKEAGEMESEKALVYWRPEDVAQACIELIRRVVCKMITAKGHVYL